MCLNSGNIVHFFCTFLHVYILFSTAELVYWPVYWCNTVDSLLLVRVFIPVAACASTFWGKCWKLIPSSSCFLLQTLPSSQRGRNRSSAVLHVRLKLKYQTDPIGWRLESLLSLKFTRCRTKKNCKSPFFSDRRPPSVSVFLGIWRSEVSVLVSTFPSWFQLVDRRNHRLLVSCLLKHLWKLIGL